MLPIGQYLDDEHEPYGDAEHAVGDVKCRPVLSGPVDHIDKIPHAAVVEYPVVEISADPRSEQCQRDEHEFSAYFGEEEDAD